LALPSTIGVKRIKNCNVEGGATRGMTALVYSVIHSMYVAYIQGLYKGDTVHPTGLTTEYKELALSAF
jgi:hypothetical protein